MTLLELLVKELPKRGGWPKGIEKISQSPIDGELYLFKPCEILTGRGIYFFEVSDFCWTKVYKRQYEAAIAAQQTVWNGEGLPPVGSKVESFINGDWRLVKVVYVGETGGEYEALVFDVKTTKPAWSDQFRPIRTEADRKRGEAIDALISLGVFTRPVAEKTVDAIAAGKIPGLELTK